MIHGVFLALFRLAKSFSFLATLGIMLSWQVTAVLAGQVTLSWDTNTESNLGGYRVYYGQVSRNYSANTDVGKQTQYTVTGLEEGKIFYFAVTAYDNTRTIESGFSNEVSTTIQPPPPVPAISLMGLIIFAGLLGLIGVGMRRRKV